MGTILACKEAVLRLSTKRGGSGGSIVNISSIAARLGGLPGLAPYAATKGAVESFTKGLATEVGPEGIRVNAVAPGFTETDMNRDQIAHAGLPRAHRGDDAAAPGRRARGDRRGGGLAHLARGPVRHRRRADRFRGPLRKAAPRRPAGMVGNCLLKIRTSCKLA